MVRLKILVLSLLLPLLLIGCGSNDRNSSKKDNRIEVLSTIAQIGDLVTEVGGERIHSQVLVRGEINPHSYELVKGDDEKIQMADCLFYNGLGLEHGASVAAMIQDHPNAMAVGEQIEKEKILWKDSVPDPHVWMDISLWKETVDPIAQKLIELDPEGEQYYLSRAVSLKEKMEHTDSEIYTLLQKIPEEKRYLVTSHDAFQYFTRRYLAENNHWQDRFAAPEGLSPDGQLNVTDLRKIVDHLHQYHIEVLFPESNVSRDSIRKIASAGKALGLELRICQEVLYGDALRGSYLDAMKHNAEVIAKHLKDDHESL